MSGRIRQLSREAPSAMAERVLGFLERLYPYNTAMMVARDTRLHRPTISKWFERRSAPSAQALARLIAAYGPDFVAAMVGDSLPWLTVAAWHERRVTFEADQAVFEAEMGAVLYQRGEP